MEIAIGESLKSKDEDSRPHPRVGVVIVKDGKILATSFRGEVAGRHGEYVALEKKLEGVDLSGATVFTTLEPCTTRNHPKIPCARRIVERQVGKVVIGMLDPDWRIRGRGVWDLKAAGIIVEFCAKEYEDQIMEINANFIKSAMKTEYKTSWLPVSATGDGYFENLDLPYRRISIVPLGEMAEIIPPSTENDTWLDNNRPNLMFGYPKPAEYGVAFEIPRVSYAAVSRTGELYYSETMIEQSGIDLGATIRLVGRMLEYAARVYQKFPLRGRLAVEYKLALVEEMELTLSDMLERIVILRNSKHIVSPVPKSVRREIDTEDFKDLNGQAVLVVNDLLRALELGLPAPTVSGLVTKYS